MAQGHYRNEYRCGHVMSQCRCPGPKTVSVAPEDCEQCKEAGATLDEIVLSDWQRAQEADEHLAGALEHLDWLYDHSALGERGGLDLFAARQAVINERARLAGRWGHETAQSLAQLT